jgi:ankyrin repeat protein
LNNGVSLNSVNRAHNHTPLLIAAKRGHSNLVKYLVNKNASRKKNIQDAFTEALRSGHEKIVEYLINKGAKVNAKGMFNHTPLLIAATRGRSNMPLNKIKKLLDILVKAGAKNMSYLKNSPNSSERKLIDNAIKRNKNRKNSRRATMFTLMSFKGNHGRMDPHIAHMIARAAKI